MVKRINFDLVAKKKSLEELSEFKMAAPHQFWSKQSIFAYNSQKSPFVDLV